MSTHRRRPTPSAQPQRRPRVAGLRKPSPRPRPRPEVEDATEDAVATEDAASDAADTVTTEDATEDAVATEDAASDAADTVTTEDAVTTEGTASDAADTVTTEDAASGEPADEQGAVTEDSADEPDGDAGASEPVPAARSARIPVIALSAVAVVLALVAGVFAYQYFGVRGVTENKAFADPALSNQAQQDITEALETLLSYHYEELDEYERRVQDILVTDEAKAQFAEDHEAVREQAPERQLIVNTGVSYLAPMELSGDSASMLAFVVQRSNSAGAEDWDFGVGLMQVDAQLSDGTWRIAGVRVYGEPPAGMDSEDAEDDGN